jgi:hypothetical protein
MTDTSADWFDPENPFEIKDASLIKTDLVPIGTYIGTIVKAEPKRSSQKGTPFVNLAVQVDSAEVVDNAGYEGRFVWYEMYVTPNTGEMVKGAVTAIDGKSPEGPISLMQKCKEWPGYKVRFLVDHDDSGNEPRARIKKFLPYNPSAPAAGGAGFAAPGAQAPPAGAGFSI